MSIELIDKEVSTEDLGTENVEEKEVQKSISKEKEKKEATNFEKLEAVLSVLVENKIMSIRNYGNKAKGKNLLFNKFRTKSEEDNNAQGENRGNKKIRANSSSTLFSSSKCGCHQYGRRSIIPCESSEFCRHKVFSRYPQPSIESSHQINLLYPQQSFESYDATLYYKPPEEICCNNRTELEQRLDRKRLSVQKCLPKRLSTEQWLNSTSRQTSTETATTSSGYISPTFGLGNKRHRSALNELDAHQTDVSTEITNDVDCETIIEMSKIQAQRTLDEVEECKSGDQVLTESKAFSDTSMYELEQLKNGNSHSKVSRMRSDESCKVFMPQCLSTTCLPSCRHPMIEDQGCFNLAPYRHLHPSGGHYVSCCNSPTHSFQRFKYDENYITLAMNLEDLEFEQEEERRKRRKRKKKRRKERQIRARGLMADELKNVQKAAKVIDPEDLPKRARWTIVATACLLLIMSMLLVGVTLRMAPIIDEMVRKENEEMIQSLNRQGSIKEVSSLNITRNLQLGNSSNRH